MVRKNGEKAKPIFLVVEGDEEKQSHIIDTLRELGHHTYESASDGAAAFHILKRRPIDCVICAWKLPQMSGLTLLKIISADDELYQLPFIILTSIVDRETVIDAGKYGVTTVLLEPVQASTLKVKIDNIFNGKDDPYDLEVEMLMTEARKLTKDGEFNKALGIYNRILELREDAEVYYNIGYINIARDRYDEALIAFRKAVMINGNHGRAFTRMGEVHLKMDEDDKAEFCFQKAGGIFLDRDMHSAAENAFKEVLKLNPGTTNVYNSLGILYRKSHNFKEAISMYQKALKVDSEDENIHYNLGRALLEDGRVEEAKKHFHRALALEPDFTGAKKMLQAIDVGFD